MPENYTADETKRLFAHAETLERNAIRAKVRRMINGSAYNGLIDGGMLIAFLDLRTQRCNKRHGGLGK